MGVAVLFYSPYSKNVNWWTQECKDLMANSDNDETQHRVLLSNTCRFERVACNILKQVKSPHTIEPASRRQIVPSAPTARDRRDLKTVMTFMRSVRRWEQHGCLDAQRVISCERGAHSKVRHGAGMYEL